MLKGIQKYRINNPFLQIGISLGSTNSYLSVLEVGTQFPKVIKKFRTEVITKEKGCQTSICPKDRIFGFNCLLGRKFDDHIVQKEMNYVPYKIVRAPNGVDAWVQTSYGHLCSPTQMLTGFFKKMKDLAESIVGESVDSKVVLTFPSKFHWHYIRDVVEAAKIAGLGSLSFIHEFTAAATSHGCIDKEGVFAIVDLGARSFDVSLFEVGFSRDESYRDNENYSREYYKRGFKLKGIPKRDLFLGGKDFDNAIVEYMMSEIKGIQGTDLAEDCLVLHRLREVAEEGKIQLSSSTEYEITLPSITSDASGEGKHMHFTLTRSKFECLVTDLVVNIINHCESCLNEAGMTTKDVCEVVLVVGMSRVPIVRKVVTEVFGKKPIGGVNPDEAVALGTAAAVYEGSVGVHSTCVDGLPAWRHFHQGTMTGIPADKM